MGQEISVFPGQPSTITTVTIGGAQYRLRLTWRHRVQGWYLDIMALDETPILMGRRLAAGWNLTKGIDLPDGPKGRFFVYGSDGYQREDLGVSLKLIIFQEEEFPVVDSSDAPSVELV